MGNGYYSTKRGCEILLRHGGTTDMLSLIFPKGCSVQVVGTVEDITTSVVLKLLARDNLTGNDIEVEGTYPRGLFKEYFEQAAITL